MGNHRLSAAVAALQSKSSADGVYNHKSFIDAAGVFIEALREAHHGKALLDEWGMLISNSTSSEEYRRSWETGVRRCLKLMPSPSIFVNADNVQGGQTLTVEIVDSVMRLRRQKRRLVWEVDLEHLSGGVESVLADSGRSLDQQARTDLSQWWDAAYKILSRARLIHADGCFLLKSMSDGGYQSLGRIMLSCELTGIYNADCVLLAAKSIVDQLPEWQDAAKDRERKRWEEMGSKAAEEDLAAGLDDDDPSETESSNRGRKENPERDERILQDVESGLYTMEQVGKRFDGISRSAVSKAAKRARERRESC